MTDRNIGATLLASAKRYPDKPALLVREGDDFTPVSYRELASKALEVGRAIRAVGVAKGERVAIMADNCPEWVYADWGAQLFGVVTVPIYPTLSAQQAAYILRDSGAKLLFCEDEKLRKTCEEAVASLTEKPTIVCFAEGGLGAFANDAPALDPDLSAPADLCTIIYTSGTTGDPKGVMLTHENLLSNMEGVIPAFHVTDRDLFFCFLPLSHIFGRMVNHFLAVFIGATIAFPKSLRTLAQDMTQVKPTVFVTVPRFLDQVQTRIVDAATEKAGLAATLFRWARAVGKKAFLGSRSPLVTLQYQLAQKLVGAKVRARFGGRLRLLVSGGAALPMDTAEFYSCFGMPILQGYGLTETSPVISINRAEANRFGTVGQAIDNVEVRIAADGEIQARGLSVMRGYYNLPEATAEAIDPDGWFHTGDIGEVDADGYLRITDRKKDLLVLANGKNVAPQPIENLLKSSPLIEEAVVFGDGQSVVTALIIPRFDPLRAALSAEEKDNERLAAMPEAHKAVKGEVERLCKNLAEYERVKRFVLLAAEFTIAGGELTPSLKVRRKVVKEKYAIALSQLKGE